MSESRWFRVNCDWWESDWVCVLGSETRLAWILFLGRVKTHGSKGAIPKEIATDERWRMPEATLQGLIERALEARQIIDEGDKWRVAGWASYESDEYTKNRRRWIRMKEAGGSIRKAVRIAIMDAFGHQCAYCKSPDDLTVDHIYPVAKGGTNKMENLQVLCRRCNSRKKDRTGVMS